MPSAEVPIDEDLVRRLLASQFPQWAALPLRATSGIGWDNAMFRLGEDLAVRLPRRELAAGRWSSSPVWVHGDLHPANLLIEHGQLSGVVDWGDITAGDPASDIAVAWMLVPASSRRTLYDEAGVDDATRMRARAWAALL